MATTQNDNDLLIGSETRTLNIPLPSQITVPTTQLTGQINAGTQLTNVSALQLDASQVNNLPTVNPPYISTSNPTSGQGVNGDTWWNSSTQVLWHKVNGSWVQAGTVNASSIVTGTLSAAVIGAASITANKLNVSKLSAISADIGDVTAGNIKGTANLDIAGTAKFKGSITVSEGVFSVTANESKGAKGGIVAYSGSLSYPAIWGIAHSSGSQAGVHGAANEGSTKGVTGVASTSTTVGVYAVNLSTGFALTVAGKMSISSTVLVTNLNAERWNGCTNTNSTSSGSATATFNPNNKPGINSTNVWWPVVIGGTTYRIPVWQ